MNIPIERTSETVVIPKINIPAVMLTPEQLDGMVQLLIDQGGMRASERIGSHNLQSLTISATEVQAADEDGSHTIYKPAFKVEIVLK